jgi:NAD(P)-dependent dehydrogenase (short-subunit alcohol dehydrogenase family)
MADQVAVLTGGASGIGLASAQALAQALARSGVTVMIADAKGASEAAGAIIAAGGQASGFSIDVSDEAAFADLAAEVEARFDLLDMLLTAAGIGFPRPELVEGPRAGGGGAFARTLRRCSG